MEKMLVSQHIIDRIESFYPNDKYHGFPLDDREMRNPNVYTAGYEAAIDRVIKLLKGDITDWKDR